MKQKITAVLVERLFIVLIVLLIGLMSYNFYYVRNLIKVKSVDADHAEIDADISKQNTSRTNAASEWLIFNQSVVQRADKIIGDSKLYKYQNQIVTDLESYAVRSEIKVNGYTFTGAKQSPTTATATTPQQTPAAPTSATSTAAPTASSLKIPKGISATYVDVSIAGTVSYKGLLNFIKLIEQNVTRMQITNITLTPDPTGSGLLSSPTMTILVFTR